MGCGGKFLDEAENNNNNEKDLFFLEDAQKMKHKKRQRERYFRKYCIMVSHAELSKNESRNLANFGNILARVG